MSIANIRPSDCPAELRVKIEKVMKRKRLTWRDAVIFLAREVVSPKKRKA